MVDHKTGKASIAVTSTGAVLAEQAENFPLDTSDDYILAVLLQRTKQMMIELAAKQIPASFSFTVDSDTIRLRRLFDL